METYIIDNRRVYSGYIIELPANGLFIFGSNTNGFHGLGAAKTARNHFGAEYGNPRGRQGRSYAIVTKDLTKKVHPSISKKEIIRQIAELYEYARRNPNLDFYIAYSGTGKNLNGYSNEEMASMFSEANSIPDNIVFEEEFSKLIVFLDGK